MPNRRQTRSRVGATSTKDNAKSTPPATPSIAQILGRTGPREYSGDFSSKACVGIELELEGTPHVTDLLESKWWRCVSDGSLRNGGVEIVNRRPVSGALLSRALDNLEDTLKKTDWSASERCSTHIHMDVSRLTVKQLYNFLCCCIVFEPTLFQSLASERIGNMFCVPTASNTPMINRMRSLGVASRAASGNVTVDSFYDWPKYSAISLYRLPDLGTVEFRMFNAITDKEQYIRVLEFLYRIREYSLSFVEDPQQIIDFKKINSLRDLYLQCFGQDPLIPDIDESMEKGVQLLNDLLVGVETQCTIQEQSSLYEAQLREAEQQLQRVQRGLPFEQEVQNTEEFSEEIQESPLEVPDTVLPSSEMGRALRRMRYQAADSGTWF